MSRIPEQGSHQPPCPFQNSASWRFGGLLRALRRASWHRIVEAAGMGSRRGELDCEHAGGREREPERQFELFHFGSPLFLYPEP